MQNISHVYCRYIFILRKTVSQAHLWAASVTWKWKGFLVNREGQNIWRHKKSWQLLDISTFAPFLIWYQSSLNVLFLLLSSFVLIHPLNYICSKCKWEWFQAIKPILYFIKKCWGEDICLFINQVYIVADLTKRDSKHSIQQSDENHRYKNNRCKTHRNLH